MLVPLFLIPSVFAQENSKVDADRNLLASCKTFNSDPDQISAMQCKYYIRGFLAGAWGVDNVTTEEIKKEIPETFSERAYRTRVGGRAGQIKVKPVTYFCSPIDESETRIIEVLSKELVEPIETINGINTKIYEAIKVVCPSNEEIKK